MQSCQKKASQAGMSLQCWSLMLLCLSSCHFAQALPLGLRPKKQPAFYSRAENWLQHVCCCCCCWMNADEPCSHSPVLMINAEGRNPQQAVNRTTVLQTFNALAPCNSTEASTSSTLTSISLTLLSQYHWCVVFKVNAATLALTYKLAWAACGQPNMAVSSKDGAPEAAYQLCH